MRHSAIQRPAAVHSTVDANGTVRSSEVGSGRSLHRREGGSAAGWDGGRLPRPRRAPQPQGRDQACTADLAAMHRRRAVPEEIETTANLQHPHILPLFDSGRVDGTVFYVMPYVEGESLRSPARAGDSAAHRRRDPDRGRNRRRARLRPPPWRDPPRHQARQRAVPRRPRGGGRLRHRARPRATAASSTRMTEAGVSLGTPAYMSPEQAAGRADVDPRTDVYALGAVLYEMLAGQPPFTGRTAQAILKQVMSEEPRPLARAPEDGSAPCRRRRRARAGKAARRSLADGGGVRRGADAVERERAAGRPRVRGVAAERGALGARRRSLLALAWVGLPHRRSRHRSPGPIRFGVELDRESSPPSRRSCA